MLSLDHTFSPELPALAFAILGRGELETTRLYSKQVAAAATANRAHTTPPHLPLTENFIAALLVGADVDCEDGLDDEISVDGVDTDVDADDVNGEPDTEVVDDDVSNGEEVADAVPAWLADLSRDEGGAIEPLRLLDAFALDLQQVRE